MNDETESTESSEVPESADFSTGGSGLTSALSSTLDSLNQSIERMEAIVRNLQSGDSDWEESVRLLSEANELAMESSQKLDRVVQDVVYGSSGDEEQEQDRIPGL
ncbi:MAG: exodeoxyribonuclease VII small subunit [Thermoleophilia bacterium]